MLTNNLVDKARFEEQLNDRWSWITEDIEDAETRLNTQLVLENSYRYMIQEGSIARNWLENNILSEEVIEEAPQMRGAVGDYVIPKVMFPIIRRVMPELIANKLVSVQPIQQQKFRFRLLKQHRFHKHKQQPSLLSQSEHPQRAQQVFC
jgi:hypothetical protein